MAESGSEILHGQDLQRLLPDCKCQLEIDVETPAEPDLRKLLISIAQGRWSNALTPQIFAGSLCRNGWFMRSIRDFAIDPTRWAEPSTQFPLLDLPETSGQNIEHVSKCLL
jgi:hypothetical protein